MSKFNTFLLKICTLIFDLDLKFKLIVDLKIYYQGISTITIFFENVYANRGNIHSYIQYRQYIQYIR